MLIVLLDLAKNFHGTATNFVDLQMELICVHRPCISSIGDTYKKFISCQESSKSIKMTTISVGWHQM